MATTITAPDGTALSEVIQSFHAKHNQKTHGSWSWNLDKRKAAMAKRAKTVASEKSRRAGNVSAKTAKAWKTSGVNGKVSSKYADRFGPK